MAKRGKAARSAQQPSKTSAADMIAEAEGLIPRMAAPLYKGCLRIAVDEAKAGSIGYLEEQLPLARARLARQDEESRAQAEAETARIAAMAAATSTDKVRAEHRKLARAQAKDYERWGKRRIVEACEAIRDDEDGIWISWYAWDAEELDAITKSIAGMVWRFGLALSTTSWAGNGHFSTRLIRRTKQPPASCSGARGRRGKLAKRKRAKRRANAQWINWLAKQGPRAFLGNSQTPLQVRMLSPRNRRRRGPKGNRLWLPPNARRGEIVLLRFATVNGGEAYGPPERFVGRILRTTPLWLEVRVRVNDATAKSRKKGTSIVARLPFSCDGRALREWEADRDLVNTLIDAGRRRRGMRPFPEWLRNAIADSVSYAAAPYRPGDMVRVVQAVERDVSDVSAHIGRHGYVIALDYDSGCGQLGPHDPMVTIQFANRKRLSFWREELIGS